MLLPALLAALVWTMRAVCLIMIPLRALAMTPWLIDDSFISMQVARNLATGGGFSFDRIDPTSGTPLAWVVLTAPNHLFLDRGPAAKATVLEGALLASIASVLVFHLAQRTYGRRAAWISFLLTLLLSPLFFNALNGMETSLSTMLGLLATFLYISSQDRPPDWPGYLILGGVLGLANLARFDNLLLSLVIVALLLKALLLKEIIGSVPAERRLRLRSLLRMMALMLIVSLPSCLWSLAADGTPFPANQAGRRAMAWEGIILPGGELIWTAYFKRVALNLLSLSQLVSMITGTWLLAALAVGWGVLHVSRHRMGLPVALYLGSYLGLLATYQGYFPDVHGLRYLNLAGFLLVIMIAGFLEHGLLPRFRSVGVRNIILVCILAGLVVSTAYQYQQMTAHLRWTRGMRVIPFYSQEEVESWWAFLDWVAADLPAGNVIAAKDHGRLAYFTPSQVVDLAGIIDPQVLEALDQGQVAHYLAEKGTQYVILPLEGGKPIHQAIRSSIRIEPVEGAPLQEATGYVLFYLPP